MRSCYGLCNVLASSLLKACSILQIERLGVVKNILFSVEEPRVAAGMGKKGMVLAVEHETLPMKCSESLFCRGSSPKSAPRPTRPPGRLTF